MIEKALASIIELHRYLSVGGTANVWLTSGSAECLGGAFLFHSKQSNALLGFRTEQPAGITEQQMNFDHVFVSLAKVASEIRLDQFLAGMELKNCRQLQRFLRIPVCTGVSPIHGRATSTITVTERANASTPTRMKPSAILSNGPAVPFPD